ncbi:MAG: CotH kinase family protein [Clostridia bacterium]|nr:CotH kinase family protein [Clostridia bacterium]
MKNKWRAFLSALLCFAMVCSVLTISAFAEDEEEQIVNEILEESVLSNILTTDLYVAKDKKQGLRSEVNVMIDIANFSGTVYLPGCANAGKLRLAWDIDGLTLSRKDKTYKSGKAPIAPAGKSYTYTLKKDGLSARLKIRTMKGSEKVRPMFLELDESKGLLDVVHLDRDHETACYGVVKVGDHKKKYIRLKGRGNSSFRLLKKGYNLTVYDDDTYQSKDKTKLMKSVKTNKWSLLGSYFDNSMLRNKIALDLAKELGIGLDAELIDLWIDGNFYGNYTLTPKNDYDTPDGGYSLEFDNQPDKNQFKLPHIMDTGLGDDHDVVTIRDIGDDAKAAGQTPKTVEKWFLKAWKACLDYDSEDYQKYFDLDSWAKMYLMYELSKTYSCFSGSLFMHRDGLTGKDKLKAGPAWDFDIAFGRTIHKFLAISDDQAQLTAERWYIDSIGIYGSDDPVNILQALGRHKSFMEAVRKVFNENKKAFEGIDANITKQKKILKDSAYMNNNRYGSNSISAEYVFTPNTLAFLGTGKYKLDYNFTTTWEDYVHNLREYCNKRVLWLSDNLAPGVEIGVYTR